MTSPQSFTTAQLAAARTARWHQDGQPLLTLDDLRAWLAQTGLALYTPRHAQLPAPAPSVVEAVAGQVIESPSPAAIEPAHALLARLVQEGAAVPLNLLSTPGLAALGEQPDFICSTAVFAYVYTLRGDRNWKQAPLTSGPDKVSQLAANAWQLLHDGGPKTVAELVHELGREVTEAATLRALGELWAILRVIPVPQLDGAPAQWELTTKRLTKQIKAGANAGQPTALSALISLYLGSAIAVVPEEIEVFLSPLTARSRVRDVVHGLTAAQQLQTTVLEGKTLLHVEGSLPEFAVVEVAAAEVDVAATEDGAEAATAARRRAIKTFTPTRPAPREDRERRPFKRADGTERKRADGAERPATGAPKKFVKRTFAARPERPSTGRPSTARTPGAYSARKPEFTKPWNEGRSEGRAERPSARPYASRPAAGDRERPKFGGKPAFGDKPKFGEKKAYTPRKPSTGSYGARPDAAGSSARPGTRPSGPRPFVPRAKPAFGSKPAYGSKPSFGSKSNFGSKPGFKPRSAEGDARPPRRDKDSAAGPSGAYAGKPSFGPRTGTGGPRGGSAPGTGFGGRSAARSGPPFAKFDKPRYTRPEGEKRPVDKKGNYYGGSDSKPRPAADAGKPSFGGKPDFAAKPKFGPKPAFGAKPRAGSKPSFGDKPGGLKPAGKFAGKTGSKPGFKTDFKPRRQEASNRADGKSKPRTRTTTSSGKPRRKEGEGETGA